MNIKILRHLALLLCLSSAPMALAQEDIADVLHDQALDMKRPADRAKAVARMKIIEDRRLKNAQARGRAMGIPLFETLPNGGWRQLVDFDGERPVFNASRNLNAAISTGANLTWTSPHNLNGSGLIVGVWDGGVGRTTHQEFTTGSGSRMINIDGSAMNDHAMHVAGTIAALGADPSARGMANAAKIHAYDASNDSSEMTAAGATAPGQTATKVYTSNHSYGPDDGWSGSTWTGTGIDQNAFDSDFGRYNYGSRQIDSVIYNTPYLASFWACGNDRSSNPTNGSTVNINGQSVIYNSAIHPPGDGVYRGGFETINAESLGKNIIAIGAVDDAVTAGSRDPLKATITFFSSTGPADDGRIKPDLVANGAGLFSTGTNSDTHYWTATGTSMASPNACGSATLLVDQYNRLFTSAMRASTLKALLIHTADDIGRPGPDYFYGWGLINVKKGADLIASHASSPLAQQITESNVSTTTTTREYSFVWNGSSPIAATIAWTDPAANEVTAHDSRTPVLVNNLNLKVIAPNGAEYFPYTMPFVGTWTIASMSLNATTGINNVDNVEQVRIANPGQAGIWRVVVSYAGVITNTTQDFGLIISGLSTDKNLVLNLNASSVSEAGGNGATTGTVSRVGTSGDFVVSLSSSNTSKITVPASVTIANGQTTSPSFPINAIDNLVMESTTTTNITASASGYLPATAVINVTDNDNSVPVVSAGPDQTVFLNNTSSTQLGWSYSAWTGDADSNISDQYVYTAAHCFGNNHASVTVNNVSFTENFNTSGVGWSVGGAVTNWDGNDDAAVTGSSESLAQEFIYNGSPRTVTFSGLTVGQTYEAIFYSAGWDAVDSRVQTFSGTSQTPLVLNQNFYGDNKGIKTSCIYVATGTSQIFTITPTTGTFHLYAMLNRGFSSATANLDGTVSDANGHALTTNWTLVSGPAGPMLGNASSVDTAATFYTAGAYTFHLTANDGFSQVTDEVVVHVNPAGSGYTMTYAGNGSAGGSIPVDGTQYTLNATVTVLGNTGSLIRSGYTFNNWNTAADGTGTSYAPGATFNINTNTTLYAKWTPNTYIVTFNNQSGSGGSSSVNATFGSAMPVATAPTRTGFTFGGYYTQVSGGGTQYYNAAMASSRSWDIAANTTLNAHWIPNTYTVTLDTQSGTGGTGSVIASYDSAMPTATAPRRTGYFFGGYYTQIAGGGTQYYTATMASSRNWDIPAATTLYAKWNPPPLVNAGNDQTVQTGAIAPGTPGITYHPITNDADSGISSSKTYTHAIDFGSDTNRALINGVKFQAGGTTFGSISGTSATIGTGSTTIPTAHAGNTNAAPYLNGASTCAMEDLVKDLNYNAANGVITLTGLTSGVPYQFRLYNRAYGTAAATRGQNIGFDTNGVGTSITASEYTAAFNADDARTSGPSFATFSQVYALTLDYVLAPGVTSLKVYINATSAATYHLYGLTNEESPRVAATAMLDGTVSDAGGIPLTATWSLVSGPGAVLFGNANAIDTAATFYIAGTYTLRLTLSDGVAQSTDDVVVTVVQGTPYTTWASSSFANPLTDPASGGDPDGDGLNNLLEFAFGTDPTVGSSGPIRFLTGGNIITNGVPDIMNFAASGQPAEFHAVFARRKDHAAAGLSYTVQFSSDLNLWTPSAAGLQVETGASNTSDIEAVSVPFPSSVPLQLGGNAVPKFFRVGVSGG